MTARWRRYKPLDLQCFRNATTGGLLATRRLRVPGVYLLALAPLSRVFAGPCASITRCRTPTGTAPAIPPSNDWRHLGRARFVRGLATTLLLISVSMVWACWGEGPTPTDCQTRREAVRPTGWRRTENGWERAHDWSFPQPTCGLDRLHPALPAAMMAMISVGALIAFPAAAPTAQRGPSGKT
jgi:hypothetical protein